ncbi:MAG: hypothetical protein NZ610_04405 [Candidatus Bipolaricaulota bacterium]|nr:hypothetical protein [Candidatus Bipolaricaulota bacterium]MCS7274632.1 hypothetical protein [Candidatus Bipolaricaulota bacterium]MDW8110938.1 CARDB domain-containing protein [Candidatus Bipolaricaulota bacterium]MDW8329102.1 CARDB domain-containing protein [Candidatus Bipolaricaulota bacterium]
MHHRGQVYWGILSVTVLLLWASSLALWGQANLPDLAVKEVRISPPDLEEGDSAQVRTVIVNQGRGDALGPFDILVELNGREIGYRSVFELKAQQTVELRIPWRAVAGEHRVTVYVDTPFGRVREANESNNTGTLAFKVAPPSAVRALTLDTVKVFTRALDESGQALKFQLTDNVFSSIDNANRAIQASAAALREAPTELQFVRSFFAPAWLSAQTQSRQADDIAALFSTLSDSLVRIGGTLSIGNFEGVLENAQVFRKNFADLASRQIEVTPFQPLTPALEQFDRVILLATELRNLLRGAQGRPQLEVAMELFTAFTKFGELLRLSAQRILTQAQEQRARFSDGDGQPLGTVYIAGKPLLIEIPGAHQLSLELYTASASPTLVHTHYGPGPSLQWNGTNGEAAPLPPGVYLYRLLGQTDAGVICVELGRLRVSQGNDTGEDE